MDREVRYCTTEDGVRIAYCVEGAGPPLVVCPEFVESFALDSLVPERLEFTRQLARRYRVVQYDGRGTGLSQREVTDVSLNALVRDIEAVVLAAGLRRFALYGAFTGGLRAIAYAAKHPRSVQQLALFGAFARVADVVSEHNVRILSELMESDWRVGSEAITNLRGRRQMAESDPLVADLYRRSTSGALLGNLLRSNGETDLTEQLGQIRARTIVVHYIDDEVVPFAEAQKMAVLIPGARLVPLDDSSAHPAAVLKALRGLLKAARGEQAEKRSTARRPSSFRTVFFTDVVGHTEMLTRLGDERGREVLREHEHLTRQVLRRHGGAEVKTMGDGFMASFSSVTAAVRCAIALQRALESRNSQPRDGNGVVLEPIWIRIGLNAGEPIEEKRRGQADLFGATVNLAARIARNAEGGEILASDVVRGLCGGKGFLFADRGEFVAKGFEEPVRVYEVRWREDA